jgi:hypothetical protein
LAKNNGIQLAIASTENTSSTDEDIQDNILFVPEKIVTDVNIEFKLVQNRLTPIVHYNISQNTNNVIPTIEGLTLNSDEILKT